jgi:LysM repeat protein
LHVDTHSGDFPMKKFLTHTAVIFSAFLLAVCSASAQTLSLNDGSILQSSTNRVGVNIGAIDYWDNGQILKNLIGSSNPGMEPLLNQQIWALGVAGTATTFTIPDVYDGVPPNYWTGATFNVVEAQSGGAELGCTGTIASNTGPNYPVNGVTTWVSPVITVATQCAAPFAAGDIIVISKSTFPTPEAWWETGGQGGTAGTVSGGAQLLSDTTDLCATCGTQALTMNATAAGSKATAAWYFDGESADNIFVLMNGTYQVSFWAKAVSGTPVMTISALRGTAGGFNCGTYSPKLTTSWAQYTWSCTASESAAGTTPAAAQVAFNTTGGSAYLDNVSFEKTSTSSNNPTILRDEVIEALQNYYGPSIGNNPGTFRYWVNQNGETISNWTQPDYAHAPTSGGAGYFVGPGGAGSVSLSLQDYLVICQYLNAIPYLEIPVTLTTADAANLVEFLASPSTTTFGARRAALGQSAPWTSVFSTIHLSFCNECWNGQSFSGQSLSSRNSAPNQEYYYDYSVRARDIFAAMRADSYYASSAFDLVMNAQTAVNYTMDTAIARAHPDSIEIEDYTYGPVNSFATDAALWQPAMIDPWEKVTNPTDIRNFYQSVHDYQSQTTCGASANTHCKVNIYEWGQGTVSGSLDQTHLDYINAGAGEGVVMALQPLLNLQYYGIRPQSFFSLTEYKNSATGGMNSKLWGNTIDMGGATNNVRPEFLGISLINQSIIGPMYACPINNNVTYNFTGSPNGVLAMPALNNVPYVYAFCFENGTKRSLVLINTDLSNSHTINFGGTNPPYGTVTVRQFAPTDLDDMNEAPTGTASNHAQATVSLESSTVSNPTSITLPPYSATALDYTAQGLAAAAMPTFTPAAGTYTTAQQVTLSGTTAGTTIYYTTDGSTPTTSSSVYNAPITVNANETLNAIAVASGWSNSPVASGAFSIAPQLPTPTFTPAAGTYSTTQSVSIGESQAGTTIYYTANGTTPTTSSSVYSGPISVSATETIEAIAVEAGYTNSATATSVYTIAPALPAVTFSPAPGTYTSAKAVTITEATAGAVIYYTTDGSTPTASSTQYGGALWIASSETINAIAVEKGYTNSSPVTGTFSIAPVLASPSFSLAGGTAAYTTAQTVSISGPAGAAIYYTTNGTAPSASSTKYTGPITVSSTETIEAISIETGYTNSAVTSVLYTIASTTQAPTFSPAAGTYTKAQTVTISDATSGALIYYTTNGTTPTTSSTKYSAAITVSASETIQAIAVAAGYPNSPATMAAYTIAPVLPTPTFSVAAGTYTTTQTVSIMEATAGAAIYFTTNGTTPTTSSSVYSGPITVSANETLQAIAAGTGYTNSAAAVAAYTIAPVLPTPTFSVAAGTYTTSQTVSITEATAGAAIYFTTNGSTPTTSSSVYSGPITVSANETLQAIAAGTGYTNSAAAVAAYTIAPVLPTPTFSVAAGTYTTSQTVSITEATAGAAIYFTTNGTTPTTSSNVYSGPITVSANETLQAIAAGNGYTNSAAAVAAYTIAPVLPTPSFSIAAGTYTTTQTVSITEATAGAAIYFTTNGTTPTTSSNVYSGPITVSANETLQAIAAGNGYTNSAAAVAAYTIAPVLPTPTFSVAAGTYTTTQTVSIMEATAGAAIYFTTNGTTPTTSSSVYSGPITVSANETLQAIAAGNGYTNSSVVIASYAIAPLLPAPTFSVTSGTFLISLTVSINDAAAGTTIYYTTDGTMPNSSSNVYSGPVIITATETLQAIATSNGYTNSPAASAAYILSTVDPVYIDYASNGFTASNLSLNFGATVNSGVLDLTDGGTGEIRSAWFKTKVPVSAFTTDFTFQIEKGQADGFTFTIQNDPKGIWALGYGGGGLAYQNIQNSVAVKFDIYSDAGEGTDSTGVYINGAAPTNQATDMTSSGVVLRSGDLMDAHLVYSGTTLTMTLTDTVTGAIFTKQFTVNIPSIVGGTTAYVGFTGSTGSSTAIQQITSWDFTTP